MSDVVTLLQSEDYRLEIWGGKSFVLDVEFVNVDDSGAETPVILDAGNDSIVGQIARYPGGPLQTVFSCSITDGEAGKFRVELTPAQTRKITNNAAYEIALLAGSSIIGLWSGKVDYQRGVI
jgi:hypothetical protein